MKRFILPISLFLICGVIFGVLVLLDSLFDRREEKTNLFSQLYSIEPESLLGDLEQGKIEVFSPIYEEPPWPSPDQQIPVPWTQEDYLRIADALFEFVWNDTLSDWQLHSMSFQLGCAKSGVGLQDGTFTFFKNQQASDAETRFERFINIDARDETIYVTENKYSPRLVNWSSINLENNQLSATEVLQITEAEGGQEKRLSVENACDISVWLSPDSASYRGWRVHYSRRDDRTMLFRLDIDPYTADVHVP